MKGVQFFVASPIRYSGAALSQMCEWSNVTVSRLPIFDSYMINRLKGNEVQIGPKEFEIR